MFATINTISEPENFWGKIKYNLLPPPVKAEKVEIEGSSGFLKLTVPIVRGKIYWNNVRQVAGDALSNVLAPGNFYLHEQADLRRFESERFMQQLCMNSFFKLLTLLPQRQLLQECALIDFSASLAGSLEALPRYCRTIKIVTANENKYAPFVRYCMEEYGAAVYLTGQIGRAFDSPVVLYPKRAAVPTAFSRNSLVFAAFCDNLYTSHLLTPEGATVPARYLKLMPKGINPLQFAAALYEVSGLQELAGSVCPAFRENNRILSYKDTLQLLDK